VQTHANDRIAIRLNKNMAQKIKRQALKENRNLSEILRQLIYEYLESKNKKSNL
jgi:metal-responsive CopG/Arc/MetJ family transcriptional regulator